MRLPYPGMHLSGPVQHSRGSDRSRTSDVPGLQLGHTQALVPKRGPNTSSRDQSIQVLITAFSPFINLDLCSPEEYDTKRIRSMLS